MEVFRFEKQDWFNIAKIIDNEFNGCYDSFTHERKKGYNVLSTNKCDYSSIIKVYSKDMFTIDSILRISEDTDGYKPIQEQTMLKIINYINKQS